MQGQKSPKTISSWQVCDIHHGRKGELGPLETAVILKYKAAEVCY